MKPRCQILGSSKWILFGWLTVTGFAPSALAQELTLEDLLKKADERREKQAKQYYEDVGPTLGGVHGNASQGDHHGFGGGYSAGGGAWGKPSTSIPIIHG